ncbi:alpha/beta hydrolase [Leucobacter allii]|uniref:Alpha/beta hydrolase n=1 Tax=Leucobacter allii TaxID=2932247 RepID=A0ABY4FR64_9MICO|nr:alpha/beta hydrolase [Leucobacter allii]UOQ58752.1 alpha/beta hydrolase [Leucobacter allii]
MTTPGTVTEARQQRDTLRRGARRLLLGLVAAAAATALTGCSLLLPFGGIGGAGGGAADGGSSSAPNAESGGLGQQRPDWETCTDEGLVCATVEAPLDWDDPEGETIDLALIKREAEGTKLGTLFLNPGGPGLSGVDYYSTSHPGATGIAVKEHYDVIAWDTRGSAGVFGGTTPVVCLDEAGMDAYVFGSTEPASAARGSAEWIAQRSASAGEFAAACEENTGELLAHVDTESTVQDLEMLREIVGDEQLNFLGEDYGTFVGARYADRYPEKVGRMVLSSGWDPSATGFDVALGQATSLERILRTYLEQCLGNPECPLSGTVDEAMQSVRAKLDQLDATPGTAGDGRAVTSETFMNALLVTLTSRYAWMVPGYIFTGAVDGDYANVMEFADVAAGRDAEGYTSNYEESFTATVCLDLVAESDPAVVAEQAAEIDAAAPILGSYLAYSDLDCAEWPVAGPDEMDPVTAAGANPILVLGGTDVPGTPYAWSEALADQLESGVLVTLTTEGNRIYGASPCVNIAVDDYFMEGTVPESDPQCTEAKDEQLRADGYDGSSRWPLELE